MKQARDTNRVLEIVTGNRSCRIQTMASIKFGSKSKDEGIGNRDTTFSKNMIGILGGGTRSSDLKEKWFEFEEEEVNKGEKWRKWRSQYGSDLEEGVDGEVEEGVAHVDDDVELGHRWRMALALLLPLPIVLLEINLDSTDFPRTTHRWFCWVARGSVCRWI